MITSVLIPLNLINKNPKMCIIPSAYLLLNTDQNIKYNIRKIIVHYIRNNIILKYIKITQ